MWCVVVVWSCGVVWCVLKIFPIKTYRLFSECGVWWWCGVVCFKKKFPIKTYRLFSECGVWWWWCGGVVVWCVVCDGGVF